MFQMLGRNIYMVFVYVSVEGEKEELEVLMMWLADLVFKGNYKPNHLI